MVGKRLAGRHGVPQHPAGEAHAGRAVGQRVVQAPDQRGGAVVQRQGVDPPQGPVAVQVLREQACHLVAQPRPRDGRAAAGGHDVLGHVEAGVGNPLGAASEPPSRRVRAGAASSRAPIESRSSGTPGPPGPTSTTLHV